MTLPRTRQAMSSENRIAGALLGMAVGDALGAGYEFADPPRGEVAMIGGGLGNFAPGEWTDGTSMAVCIAEVTATGPDERLSFWADAIRQAEQASPRSFTGNGFTVTALQAAHAAVVQTPIPDAVPAQHLQDAVIEAVRMGNDTDTVAAIAGMLLGARWGASAVPFAWRDILHGWPGLRADDLARLAILTADGTLRIGHGSAGEPGEA